MRAKLPAVALMLVYAVAAPVAGAAANLAGDAAAGQQKAAVCAGCHGPDGNSLVPLFPKLAGQHATYLAKQLHAFKSGARPNPMMSGMAMPLTEQDIADIAAYYARQKMARNPAPTADDDEDDGGQMAALLARGGDLYRNGNLATEVSACIACHGPAGEGNKPAAFPALNGQHVDYLVKTLTDYQTGARGNQPDNIMRMIAKKMTAEEIKAVSHRIAAMPVSNP